MRARPRTVAFVIVASVVVLFLCILVWRHAASGYAEAVNPFYLAVLKVDQDEMAGVPPGVESADIANARVEQQKWEDGASLDYRTRKSSVELRKSLDGFEDRSRHRETPEADQSHARLSLFRDFLKSGE